MLLKLIACEVMFREFCYCAARTPSLVDFEFLSQGYHDNPEVGRQRLQERIDRTPAQRYDALLLGYGLCNNLLSGLAARDTPLIIPRAHDCITFFLGSRQRYQQLFAANPGTYYYTSGWLEHRQRGGERPARQQAASLGADRSFAEMVARYGDDNARYLLEFMNAWTKHYSRGVFVDFPFTAHLGHCQQAAAICQANGWAFERVDGDLTLVQALLDGDWDEDRFQRVRPGQRVRPCHDGRILEIAPLRPDEAPAAMAGGRGR